MTQKQKSNQSKVLTTHVGSLPRTQNVVDCIFARENGNDYDQAVFDAVIADAVQTTVDKQIQAGIDVVSDGENSKISYATYIKDRYTGFSGDSPRNPPADLQRFPTFLKRIAQSGGTPQYARPMCTGAVAMTDSGKRDLLKDIDNLKAALAKHKGVRGFMGAASPGVVSLFLQNQYYANRIDYLQALSKALSFEYKTIVDAGFDVQIDCPDLALSRHMIFTDLSDSAFIECAEHNVAALNHALLGINPDSVRVHICWGNYEGPHVCDIAMDTVFQTLMNVNARYILFESSNPRHAHEWQVFEKRKHEIPDDKVLIPGVIDSTTNFVEHPELVAQRLRQFIAIVGADRVMAGSDCGFGTFAGFGTVDADIVYEKLAALRAGADLV